MSIRSLSGMALAVGLYVLSPAASAATQRIVTVKASGGNYTSLAAAIAGESKNLVSLDRQLTIQCYSSAAPDTTQVVISDGNGWVTDGTHYIYIVVPVSERHVGRFDPTKYHRVMNNYQEGIFVNGVPYTRIEGLQFYVSEANYSPSYPIELAFCDNCLIDTVIINAWYGFQAPRHGIHITLSNGAVVRNTIIYGVQEGGIALYWSPVTIDNVTIVNKGLYNNAAYGVDWGTNGGTGHLFRNVYAGGCMTACFNGPISAVTMTTSASSDATGTIKNVTLPQAAFVSSSALPIDLHIQSSSVLKGAGTDLSAWFTTDIDGQTRTPPWDIGADQTPSGPPPTPNEKFVRALYQDLLGRMPTPAELQQATSQLGSGVPRSTIVQNLCSSAEGSGRITNMVQNLVLNQLFQSFLQRLPNTGEISFGDAQLHSPLTQVLISILGSDEYFQRAQSR